MAKKGPSSRALAGHVGDIAFAVVVLASYVATLTSSRPFTLREASLLIVTGIAYLSLGIYGFALCERLGSPLAYALYFGLQIPLGTVIVYLSRGNAWLILLPLAGQSVTLRHGAMLLVCALLFVAELSPFMLAGNWAAIGQVAAPFLAAIVFVVLFTQLAVNEQRARAKVEQLAAELSEANAKLRDYALRVEELAAAEERNRLAREIHDTLGHYLTAINVQLEAARAILEADRDRALDALHKAQMLAKEGLADVRRSVAALRATPTESRPLREAVQALAEECRAAGIRTEVVVQGDVRPLKPQAELTLYRAAQEGLTNVRRHAQASQVCLTLDYTSADTVRLSVEDNGVGAAEGAASGFGLLGIRERAQILGGQVRVHSRPGQGFALEVEVPG